MAILRQPLARFIHVRTPPPPKPPPLRCTYRGATLALAGERLLRRRLQATPGEGVVLQLYGTVVVVLETRMLVKVERSRISLSCTSAADMAVKRQLTVEHDRSC